MMKALRVIAAILIVPAAYILQTTLFQAIRIGSIIPDVILIITVALALTKGEVYAILTGFFMGLLCDIFSMDLIGFYALFYSFAGFLCARLGRNLYIDDLKFPAAVVFFADLAKGIYGYVFLFLLQNHIFTGTFLLRYSIPEAVYTTLVSLILYPLIRLLFTEVLKDRSEPPKGDNSIASIS